MREKLKRLGKDSIIYGIGDVASKGIGFFLLPILTRTLGPAEYGAIEMLVVMTAFIAVALTMGMEASRSFYFFEKKEKGIKEQARVVSAVLKWHILWGGFVVLTATLASPFLNRHLFGGHLSYRHFAVAFLGGLFTQLMYHSAEVLRFLYRPWPYILLMLGNTVVSILGAIFLVSVLKLGIMGYFAGILLGAAAGTLIGWRGIRRYISFKEGFFDMWPALLRFGLPLVPSSFLTYVLFTSDRWMISCYLTPYDLGIYAVGMKFALIISLAAQAFVKSFMPLSLDEIHSSDRSGSDRLFEVVFRYYSGLSLFLAVVLTAFSSHIVRLASAEFYGAYRVIGVLALSSVFFNGTYFSCLGTWKKKKTHLYSVSVAVACVVVLALNALLIPHYGIVGAAAAKSAAMFVLLALSFYFSQKEWRIRFGFTAALSQLAITVFFIAAFIRFYKSAQADNAVLSLWAAAASVLILCITVRKNELSKIVSSFKPA